MKERNGFILHSPRRGARRGTLGNTKGNSLPTHNPCLSELGQLDQVPSPSSEEILMSLTCHLGKKPLLIWD